jgi:hypothetical protein
VRGFLFPIVFIIVEKIIRKILKEYSSPPEGNKDERIIEIEKRKKRIDKLIPLMVEFFEDKFGDELIKIEVDDKKVHYGNELYSTTIKDLKFFFSDKSNQNYRMEIIRDINSFFGIDITYYGVPLNVETYKMVWKQI